MAIFQSFSGFDMAGFNFNNLANGDSYIGNVVSFEVDYANGFADIFGGFGFSYSGNKPVSGTVLTYGFGSWTTHTLAFSATGLSIPMVDIVAASLTTSFADDAQVLARALSGPDKMTGSPFVDRFIGFGGNDTIKGKGGADTFIYLGADGKDTISDFSHKQHDKIDLSLIDAKSGSLGNQAFKFIGDDDFHHAAGEVRFAGHKVLADTNGDGHADLTIKLSGVDSLHGNDFFL